MIDWLKYLPVEFRFLTRDSQVDYKKPSFREAKPIILLAGGNTIRLRAPNHKSHYRESPVYVRNQDGMDTSFKSFHSSVATDNWRESTLISRSIDYPYAWFRGAKGTLNIYMSIVTRAKKKAFANTSFFHPRSFEFILTNFLNTQYGFENTKGVADYMAPVNWQVHQQLPVFSASFDVAGNPEKWCYFFPISDMHFIRLSFSYTDEYDEAFRKELKSLAQQIIQSLTLELGPQSQAQWDRVKAACPDMQLSESFAPLQWPIKPEDIEKPAVVIPEIHSAERLIQQ